MTLEGYCSCGRKSTGKYAYRRHENYCSRYCHDFEEIEVQDGKTGYELWVGTGKYAYNPPYPKLTMNCSWCGEKTPLGRNMSDANKWFCSSHCSKQAHRNPKSTSSRNGSTQISNQIRMMMVLRENSQFLSAKEIAQYFTDWFRKGCSPNSVSSTMRVLTARGWVKVDDTSRNKKYACAKGDIPLNMLFGETDEVLGRGEKA